MKIIADDKVLYIKGALDDYATTIYKEGKDISPKDVKNADALLIRTRTKCDANLLEDSSVKIVATATIGTDHLDIPWLESAGIEWANAPGCNSESVKQYIASILAHLILQGVDPKRTTIGIVGVGMVGSKIYHLAQTLGFKVLLNDPPRARKEGESKFSSLKNLLTNSDIITFHTPLNMDGEDKTFHLLNEETISLLKPGAIVINSSRGEVTKTEALLSGLEQGVISKLVLDVWENEPNIDKTFLTKVWLATPHIAGYSADGKANGSTMAIQAISKKLNLPTVHWTPSEIPLPNTIVLTKPNDSDAPIQTVAKALLQTYDVIADSERLKKNPSDFEQQRGSYPVRREFHIWEITRESDYPQEALTILKELGFKSIG